MTRQRRRLRVADWPDADRAMWAELFRTGDILDGAGPLAHLRPATRGIHETAYAFWLGFLRDAGVDLAAEAPVERMTDARLLALSHRPRRALARQQGAARPSSLSDPPRRSAKARLDPAQDRGAASPTSRIPRRRPEAPGRGGLGRDARPAWRGAGPRGAGRPRSGPGRPRHPRPRRRGDPAPRLLPDPDRQLRAAGKRPLSVRDRRRLRHHDRAGRCQGRPVDRHVRSRPRR